MSVCIIRSCCCFDNTKDGSVACGVYTSILAVLGVISNSLLLAKINNIPGADVYQPIFTAALAIYSIQFIVSMLLICAVATNKRICLVPWMVCIVLQIAMHSYGIIEGIKQFNVIVVVVTLIIGSLLVCLDVYCFVCVRSHYYVLSVKDSLNSPDLSIYARF